MEQTVEQNDNENQAKICSKESNTGNAEKGMGVHRTLRNPFFIQK